MLTVTDVSLQFQGSTLYKHVDLKFAPGNCYGIIGANGAGKSTLLRILSGALEPTTGSVSMGADDRMSVLEQDHYKYDEYSVMDTVIMGNRKLYDIMKEKEALYAKPDFSDADGERAAELEGEFAEMNGWDAETEADQLLNGLGIARSQYLTIICSEIFQYFRIGADHFALIHSCPAQVTGQSTQLIKKQPGGFPFGTPPGCFVMPFWF